MEKFYVVEGWVENCHSGDEMFFKSKENALVEFVRRLAIVDEPILECSEENYIEYRSYNKDSKTETFLFFMEGEFCD